MAVVAEAREAAPGSRPRRAAWLWYGIGLGLSGALGAVAPTLIHILALARAQNGFAVRSFWAVFQVNSEDRAFYYAIAGVLGVVAVGGLIRFVFLLAKSPVRTRLAAVPVAVVVGVPSWGVFLYLAVFVAELLAGDPISRPESFEF